MKTNPSQSFKTHFSKETPLPTKLQPFSKLKPNFSLDPSPNVSLWKPGPPQGFSSGFSLSGSLPLAPPPFLPYFQLINRQPLSFFGAPPHVSPHRAASQRSHPLRFLEPALWVPTSPLPSLTDSPSLDLPLACSSRPCERLLYFGVLRGAVLAHLHATIKLIGSRKAGCGPEEDDRSGSRV